MLAMSMRLSTQWPKRLLNDDVLRGQHTNHADLRDGTGASVMLRSALNTRRCL